MKRKETRDLDDLEALSELAGSLLDQEEVSDGESDKDVKIVPNAGIKRTKTLDGELDAGAGARPSGSAGSAMAASPPGTPPKKKFGPGMLANLIQGRHQDAISLTGTMPSYSYKSPLKLNQVRKGRAVKSVQ